MTKYLLVNEPTGITADELGRRVGLRAFDSPLGTVLVNSEPFDFYGALAKLDLAMHPNRCRCGGALHRPDCPAGGWVT